MFALTARGLGKVSLPFALLVGLVLCTAIWFLFARVLQLSLPTGPLEHLILDLLTPPAPGASA